MLAECEVFQSFPMVLSLDEAEQAAFVMISEETAEQRSHCLCGEGGSSVLFQAVLELF